MTPPPDVGRPGVRKQLRVAWVLATVVAVNLACHVGHWASPDVVIPVSALGLLAAGLASGLSWSQLGLGARQLLPGLGWAFGLVLACGALMALAVYFPTTSNLLRNSRFRDPDVALWTALVVVPLFTVLPEELLFRGVLHAAIRDAAGLRGAYLIGAPVFGLWHVTTSLTLTSGNPGLSGTLGSGAAGQLAGVLAAVVVTSVAGAAFIWLRERSGSLLAPIGLHWATNGMGALAAAAAWQMAG